MASRPSRPDLDGFKTDWAILNPSGRLWNGPPVYNWPLTYTYKDLVWQGLQVNKKSYGLQKGGHNIGMA